MSKYLKNFVEGMKSARYAADNETNPLRKAILNNYCEHASLEFSCRDYDILVPSRMVTNPLYHVKRFGTEMATYEGLPAVQGYYEAVNREVILLNDEQLMVNDWGLSSYSKLIRFVSGARLSGEGHAGPFEPDSIYVQSSPLAMFWPYNSDGILLGEDVFELDRPTMVKAAPEDIVTFESRSEATRPFLPPNCR